MNKVIGLLKMLEDTTKALGTTSHNGSIVELLDRANKLLKHHAVLCGGLATNYYAKPRMTTDVDFCLLSFNVYGVEKILINNGFTKKELFDYKKGNVTTYVHKFVDDKTGLELDLISYDNDNLNKLLSKTAHDNMLSIEGIIITKIISSRYKDLGDIESIIEYGTKFDKDLIKSTIVDLGLMSKWPSDLLD